MERVVLDGVEFTKASTLAKKYKYTSDYIGQLARAKKVSARLVGRTWYVGEESLLQHRSTKYPNLKSTTVSTPRTNTKRYIRRVEEPLKPLNKNIKIIERESDNQEVYATVTYESDDFSLVPSVNKVPKVSLLKVKIADASTVKIDSFSKQTATLKPEPIPEVYLKGKLAVGGYGTDDEAEEEISDKRDNVKNKDTLRLKVKRDSHEESHVAIKSSKFETKNDPHSHQQSQSANRVTTPMSHTRVSSQMPLKRTLQIKATEYPVSTTVVAEEKASPFVFFGILLSALVIAFFLFSIESIWFFDDFSTESRARVDFSKTTHFLQ